LENLKQTIKVIKALSDEGRLRIMDLLNSRNDICVCEITAIIGLSQPTISSHLRVLEDAGLIDHKKDGLWVNYSVSGELDDNTKNILNGALKGISDSKLIKDDLRRLSKVDRDKICSRRKVI
jgi:ArsR family transcriptional regulator